MAWPFVESELENSIVLGWLTPLAVCIAYLYLPGPLDGVVLMLGVVASGLLLMRTRRRWWQGVLVLLWCATPLGFIRLEAVVFEARVRAHLPEFEVVARGVLSGRLGSCWGAIPSPADCQREQLPPIVRRMVINVRKDKDSVTFSFKEGTRRALRYASLKPQEQSGPFRSIAPGWFLWRA